VNKLAFFGVIILGLVLLVTHVVVTLIIGLGPQFVTSSYDMMRDVEGLNIAFALAVKEAVEEEWAKYQKDVNERKSKVDIAKELAPHFEKSFFSEKNRFDQNDVNELVRRLNKEAQHLKPHKIEMPEKSFSIRWNGPTYELETWVAIYGLVGSLMIICGTAFLAIALPKRLKTSKQPDD